MTPARFAPQSATLIHARTRVPGGENSERRNRRRRTAEPQGRPSWMLLPALPSQEGEHRTRPNSDRKVFASVVSHFRFDNKRDPLTRLASADENASSSHPLPQGGEGSKINSPLAPLGGEGPGGEEAPATCRGQLLCGTPHKRT